MSKLAEAIAFHIERDVEREIASLSGDRKECRAVFYGPPERLLAQVFARLAGDGRLLRATAADGSPVDYPVVLQVDALPNGVPQATPSQSGPLLFQNLANFRNDRDAGVYLTLVPPAGQASDTHESTRKPIGVNPAVYEGSSSVSDWWNDHFVQTLVAEALEGSSPEEVEHARSLVKIAVEAADAADQHVASRPGAWSVLERLWDLKASPMSLDMRVSLAAGFPPSDAGRIDSDQKSHVLSLIVEKLEEVNFGGAVDHLIARAKDPQEAEFIRACLLHIRGKCEAVTALRRTIAHDYAVDAIDAPATWWSSLSVERWLELLDSTDDPPAGAVQITCVNPIVSHLKGFVPIVRDAATIRVEVPEDCIGKPILVTRDAAGGAGNRRQWQVVAERVFEIRDEGLPTHKTPVRYSAEIAGAKKGSMRLISLASWEPGVIACSRTATKGSPPKVARGVLETALLMTGQGHHYLDLYLRPGVSLTNAVATPTDEHGVLDHANSVQVARVAQDEFGFEVEVSGEAHFLLTIRRPERDSDETLKLSLVAEEASPDECESYFELLLLRNRKENGRTPRSVQINGQVRSAQLQAWMIEDGVAERSFYPTVLAQDYSKHWRRRTWETGEDTIFSSGRFLNDPRPRMDEMTPPAAFVEARRMIAERVRGEDGNDLIESANLGEWITTDTSFAQAVDQYIRSYAEWLSNSPDEAIWSDLAIVTRFESDGVTLLQEPDAILVSPMHPVRFAWHCLAQRAMYLAQRKLPCPAASILDPDCIPDSITLPLRTASRGIAKALFFSVECSSDYWGILWNAGRLDLLARNTASPPLDREMGLLVGGISSGFSVSQVNRAMDDICSMLVAKPAIGVLISSASGQNNACNDGLLSWGRRNFSNAAAGARGSFGASEIHVVDDRRHDARPSDAEISNLAEDTGNAIQWFAGTTSISPDLAIIAQLETSNASALPTKLASPLGVGGLVRSRIRQQLPAAAGQLLSESRAAAPAPASGDGLSDAVANAISALENTSESRSGYVFAPSLHAVHAALQKAEFAAVSSSVVDPACFLGNWLEGTYLWDYELPSYSGRSGDSNGYYLLSRIKELDLETLRIVIARLPGCDSLGDEMLSQIVQEVARRGIPTVRGLSAGDSGATGDLGLLVATRVLQSVDAEGSDTGILHSWVEQDHEIRVGLLIPVDPFQGYLDDLAKAIRKPTLHRPDLISVCFAITDTQVRCRITPIEVKNRGGSSPMSSSARSDALAQASSFSSLLNGLAATFSEDVEMILWRLAHQNLLASMFGYGFRVYSQRALESGRAGEWASIHAKVIGAIFSSEISVEIDPVGRLVVIDGSLSSGDKDTDSDGFCETIELSQADAGRIVKGDAAALLSSMRAKIGDWRLSPLTPGGTVSDLAAGSEEAIQHRELEAAPLPPPAEPVAVATQSAGYADLSEPAHESRVRVNDIGASESQHGLELRIGETIDGFEQRIKRLNLGDTALNQLNMGVVGDLGTGKTQLLKSLIYQISNGSGGNRGVRPNILIFDYKKDYSSDDFVAATGARVVKPEHIPLNLFDVSDASKSIAPWLDRFRFFADALDKIYKGIGPVQRQRLKDAVKESYDLATPQAPPTIYDVHQCYTQAMKGGADVVTSILGDLIDMQLFTPDRSSLVSPDEFLKGVVVISLNDLGQDDKTKNMLVAIVLNVFYEHMLRIPKRAFAGANGDRRVVDSMLLVDEADNIMQYEFDVLRKILLQGREFGVGTILASQYLSHFKVGGTDYREPLLSWFVHKVPNVRAQELSALGMSDAGELAQVAERIKALGLHECLYKTHDTSGEFVRGAPFYQRASWVN